MKKLWIDDVRPAPDGFDWIKTASDAVQYLVENWAAVTVVSFDHDLGDDSESGYDVLTWIERRVAEGYRFPGEMRVHSANPVGRQNMEAAIRSINKLNGKLNRLG